MANTTDKKHPCGNFLYRMESLGCRKGNYIYIYEYTLVLIYIFLEGVVDVNHCQNLPWRSPFYIHVLLWSVPW